MSIPATDDDTHCSAIGNIVIGMANQITPINTTRGQSLRAMWVLRARGRDHRTASPKTIRSHATTPGSSVSSPSAISRYDAPQTSDTVATSPHS